MCKQDAHLLTTSTSPLLSTTLQEETLKITSWHLLQPAHSCMPQFFYDFLKKSDCSHLMVPLSERENKFLTSEAANISFFPRTQRGPGADFREGFLHQEPQASFPAMMTAGLQRGSPQASQPAELMAQGCFGCSPQAVLCPTCKESHLGCRQTQRAATQGISTRLVPPGQNNQNSLENFKLQKYVVHFRNFEMKHSFYQPAT